MVERKTLNLVVVGSIPTGGGRTFYFFGEKKKDKKKCRHRGSNLGPSDLQSDALPTELKRLTLITKRAPPVGIEPTTTRLRVLRSTI